MSCGERRDAIFSVNRVVIRAKKLVVGPLWARIASVGRKEDGLQMDLDGVQTLFNH